MESHYEETVQYTKIYALATTGEEMNLTKADMKNFYGCAIIMGCLNYPQVYMYWSKDFRNELISSAMSRNKFFRLRNMIHFVDNQMPNPTIKLSRVQPVMDNR